MAQVQLSEFLSAAGKRPFVWGEHDCMLFAADWVMALSGKDPAEKWRGRYGTEAEAYAVLARVGGFGPLIHDAIYPLGWRGRVYAKHGDIVVARAPTRAGPGLVCGICSGVERYALLTVRGLVVGPASLLLAWHYDAEAARG